MLSVMVINVSKMISASILQGNATNRHWFVFHFLLSNKMTFKYHIALFNQQFDQSNNIHQRLQFFCTIYYKHIFFLLQCQNCTAGEAEHKMQYGVNIAPSVR